LPKFAVPASPGAAPTGLQRRLNIWPLNAILVMEIHPVTLSLELAS
jgi:hypothetical protein